MDSMCNELVAEDIDKTITNSGETENVKSGSPVFKFFNHAKGVREHNLDSSDYDIPSYQINQSIKSRSSSKYENERSESVLPFSPIFSPIPVGSSLQFQPPSIHSVATVAKNIDRSYQNKQLSSSNCNKVHTVKPCRVFKDLGMSDKDISWVSSMATPSPKNVPSSKFNTVEKATFIPEEKFQNIQPRALFSPALDEDSGCHPIIFTSESDDDYEEYKSNIRLSDVCATLKQLEVKSLDLVLDNSLEKAIVERHSLTSPIMKSKKKKLGSVKKKNKGSLVMSPEDNNKYEFSVCDNLKTLDCEKIKTNCVSNFIEDDSFQSMSFSGIDELCKTLVSEQANTSRTSKTVECNKTKENNILKKFYITRTATDVYEVSSMDNLHTYAKALEEGDKCNLESCKVKNLLPETGIVRFDMLNKDSYKTDATKQLHSEMSKENNQCNEKKLKPVDEENSGWENIKQYLSESQLDVSDGEIFRTVENLEKTLASQENKYMEKLSGEKLQGNNEDTNSEASNCVPIILETCENKNNDAKDSNQCPQHLPFVAFTTASGKKLTVSEKTVNKVKEILRDNDENLDCSRKTVTDPSGRTDKEIEISRPEVEEVCGSEELLLKRFSTVSGKQIKISADALKKTRIFMSECEVSDGPPEKCDCESHFTGKLAGKFGENMKNAFFTLSGKQIQVSDEVLEKAKTLMLDFDDNALKHFGSITCAMEGFSTGSGKKIQVSAKALERAKALMAECDKNGERPLLRNNAIISKKTKVLNSEGDESSKEKPIEYTTDLMVGFSTSSGKPIQISEKALEKAKSLMANCEEGSSNFKGFRTSSGKNIQISAEAMEKAKSLMRNCENEFNGSCDRLASEWIGLDGQALDVCTECGEKAKAFDHEDKEPDFPKPSLSTALGNKLEVTSKHQEKTKMWSTSIENVREMPRTSTEIELPKMGFVTAKGTKVTICKVALAKAKERMKEWDQTKTEDSGNFDCAFDSLKTSTRNAMETTERITKSEENLSKLSTTSGIYEFDDWDEMIPSWLQVYSTRPSIASERIELSPLVCHEGGKSSKVDREYIIKSPVLGKGDRFHEKRKKRRLHFEEEKKIEERVQSSFVIPYKNSERKNNTKRSSNSSLNFFYPFKKMKLVEDGTLVPLYVKVERERAREEQEKIIQQKQKVKPMKGSHLSRKCSENQMSWKEAAAGSSPEVYSDEFLRSFGICEDVLLINVENAVAYRFKGEDFLGSDCTKNVKGIPVGDGCFLILDNDNKFGVEELKRAFLASPGVQPNLVPHGWVENHFKWIVWKFAHYERRFPQLFGGRCLTPNHIMLQLKYRYDREIDRNERSAIKKILERDDTSIKRLVLCISDIQKVTVGDSMEYKLELTDGWYSCPAQSDPAMTRLIQEGKLSVGMKLMTQGATLVNCEQGVPPLEINGEVYLKIFTNSTRRIRWDTKLGFQKNPENFPVSLGSILPQGGQISRIDVIVVRIYPMLYMEKTSDGHHVTRNRRSEEKADSEYRRFQEERMESICNEIQLEMKKSLNLDTKLNRNCLNDFDHAEDLHQVVESSSDPLALQELMPAEQRKLLENLQSNQNDRFSLELREKIEKKLEKERLNKRNVSEFLRAKIVDFRKPDFNNPAILSVWNPNEDLTSLLSEGKVISLMNVTISNSSRIHKPLHINTTRQTQYRQIVRNVKYPARKLTHLKDVSSKVCPAFEEMDVVGVVALIRDVSYGSRLSQIIYLTDLETNFVGIVFWGCCKDYGWENVLRTPSIVACSNLQWKKNYNTQDVPSLYVNENSVFTENPKHKYLKEEIERLKQSMPQDRAAFLSKCEEDLTAKLEESKWRANTSKNSSSTSSNPKETAKLRVSNGFESRPAASSTPIKSFSIRMESDEVEPSPIQKRIEKLQCYGEPPSLIPLLVRNNMKRKLKRKIRTLPPSSNL